MGGAGARAGTGAVNAEKDTLPQAVEWGRAGKRAGGPRFSGPHPCNAVLALDVSPRHTTTGRS